ncbi:MAG: hypothetical protein KDJ22_07820, partial [Candidatus Competibacteraceae bacterium]|nr:hypothetical protein [Candidatus Competibacteraceae bacterium]
MRLSLSRCLTANNGCVKTIGLCLILFLSLPFAHADTYTVTNLTDSGAGSLRQAILDANINTGVNNTIDLSSLSGQLLTQGNLNITTGTVDIKGPGADVLTIIGNGNQRIFEISSGATATLSGLTLTNGGGAILNNGTLTVTNSTLSGNTAASNDNGGAIYNSGSGATLTVVNCRLANNSAEWGGGLANSSSATLTLINSTLSGNNSVSAGGGIYNNFNGSLTITNTTLSDNVSGSYGGAIASNTGTLTLTRTALTDNFAAYHGGGIYFSGSSGRVAVSESTLSNNITGNLYCGGGINIAGGSSGGVTVVLHNNTLSGNTARDGGGLCISNVITWFFDNTVSSNTATRNGGGMFIGTGVTLNMGNSLITGNLAVSGKSMYGSSGLFSRGHNLLGENGAMDLAGGIVASASDLSVAGASSAVIGALADNGGLTQTHAPVTGSPAIDAGDNSLIPAGVTTDQRGAARIYNSLVDIGAVEVGPIPTPTPTVTTPAITTPFLPDAIVSVPYAAVLTAIGGQYPYIYTATGLPPGLSLTSNGILSGMPTASGDFHLRATVMDVLGQYSQRDYGLAVGPSLSLALVTANLPNALVNVPYTQNLAALGGQPPYVFTATGLPAGFSLSSSGVLRGTPVVRG